MLDGEQRGFVSRRGSLARIALRVPVRQVAPRHRAHDGLVVDVGDGAGEHAPAVTQHRDLCRDLADLLERVADVDHAHARRRELADDREQPLDVEALQAAGRFVEQDDARADGHRAADFDHLLHRRRETIDAHGRIEVGVAKQGKRLGGPATVVGMRQHARSLGFDADEDVLPHAQVRKQREFLVHEHHALRACIARIARAIRRLVEAHLAGVGRDGARDHPDERALACPVLADERVNGRGRHVEGCPVEGTGGAVLLGEPGERQAQRHQGAPGDTCGRSIFCTSGVARFFAVTTATPVSIRFCTCSPFRCFTIVSTPR